MRKEIIYCDRCGEDVEKNEIDGKAIGLYLYRFKAYISGNEEKVDLCDKCKKSLKKWLEKEVRNDI
jgi:hypothetical protein